MNCEHTEKYLCGRCNKCYACNHTPVHNGVKVGWRCPDKFVKRALPEDDIRLPNGWYNREPWMDYPQDSYFRRAIRV